MIHLLKKTLNKFKTIGLLLITVATSFCSYAQENTDDEIDGLIDELFFSEQQFIDELLESNLSYNFLYTSVSYNSNTYFSGRDSGTDQFSMIPQISYYHSSGFNASISGIYYENFDPKWDFTSVSLGYFNTLGNKNNIIYNVGYTKYFYNDDFDDYTNSIDFSLGVRNNKRTFGSTIAASYLFGTDNSFQIVSNTFTSFNLIRKPTLALRFQPNISFVLAKQSVTFRKPIRTPLGPKIEVITTDVFDLLNTQLSFPISLTTNSWDFELGYNLNLPNAVATETDLNTTNFFTFSIGYMFDLNKN